MLTCYQGLFGFWYGVHVCPGENIFAVSFTYACGRGRTSTTGTNYGDSMGSLCNSTLYFLLPISRVGVDLLARMITLVDLKITTY